MHGTTIKNTLRYLFQILNIWRLLSLITVCLSRNVTSTDPRWTITQADELASCY